MSAVNSRVPCRAQSWPLVHGSYTHEWYRYYYCHCQYYFPHLQQPPVLHILSHLPGDGLPFSGFLTCGVVADAIEISGAGSNHQLPCRTLGPAGTNKVHGSIALQSWRQRQLVRQSNVPTPVSPHLVHIHTPTKDRTAKTPMQR